MKKAMIYFLLLAGTLLLAGCQKEGRNGGDGDLIRFTASARPDTKTAYGDYENDDDGNPVWQRIEWQNGDQVRIFSPEATDRYHDTKHYADYRVVEVTNSGRISEAKIVNAATGYPVDTGVSNPAADENDNVNGLVWGNADSYTFYGIYPMLTGSVATTDNVNSCSFTGAKIDADQGTGDLSVNMPKYGYLTAVKAGVSSGSNVRLEFEPSFTAFEVTLQAQTGVEGEIPIVNFELVSEGDDVLAGPFGISYSGTTRSFDFSEATGKTVGITFPNGTTIAPATATADAKTLTFTVFALPHTVSNLMLRFTVKDDAGQNVTRKLRLTKDDGPIEFTGCRKHRIFGMAMPKDVWRFELDPLVLPWVGVTEETSFAENIQAKAISFVNDTDGKYGALEETDAWKNSEGLRLNRLAGKDRPGSNHYEAFDTNPAVNSFLDYETFMGQTEAQKTTYLTDHPTYYELYFQQRHMLVTGVSDPHFVITFTPMAPLAGYWTLKPESVGDQGGVEGFQFKILDGEQWQTTGWNSGQIMGVPVTIGIWPAPDSDRTKEYAMIIKAVFSTSKFGDPAFNADTEMQDVHGDGRYSYWKFILPVRE